MRVQAELAHWCARHRVSAVSEIVGAANDKWKRAQR